MNFIGNFQNSEAIQSAISRIPEPILKQISCDWAIGRSPSVLSPYSDHLTRDGRPYSKTAHVLYEFHQDHLPLYKRNVTVVLPLEVGPKTVIHEIAHVIHGLGWWIGFNPVCDYAKTNYMEAFACAFEEFITPGTYDPIRANEWLWFARMAKVGPNEMP